MADKVSSKISRKPGTSILIGISVVVALVLIIAVALAGNVRTYAPGTPEATAQAFLQALFDEDRDGAHAYLSADLQGMCDPDELDLWWVRSADSASFEEVTVDNDHAEIDLRLESRDYEPLLSPFDFYDWDRETELELDRVDGEWVITDATWPLAGCTWRES